MPSVYVVHCIDTEGPLYQSLQASFDQIKSIFGLSFEPSQETLRQLQNKEIELGGLEDEVARVVAPALFEYNDTWEKVDAMLRDALSADFRNRHRDSSGNGWVYNWHCLDHVGFTANPRRRDLGFHRVFDHYRALLEETGSIRDGMHFHHHPIPFSESAHHCATHYFNWKPMIYEIIARRIIERSWFPCVNRPGFHTTRPDSNWFLEQYIPFDYANQATNDDDHANQQDLANGRYGDWRRAPKSWQPYHPSHDDYQIPGNCRRWIARCLNVGTRLRLLTEDDVEQAFAEAADGKPVVLSFTNHDFRDIRPDVERVHSMIQRAARKFPNVPYINAEGREAMRKALSLPNRKPPRLTHRFDGRMLEVSTDAPLFGPQPFLALKTIDGTFFHDNFDFQRPNESWSYTFDQHTFQIDKVVEIGIGACDATGNVSVLNINPKTDSSTLHQL